MTDANESSFVGRRVLITGAAGGVGRAVTERMAARGATLIVTDRGEDELRQLADDLHALADIEVISTDLSSSSGIAELFRRVDDRIGGLDILVACAGVGSGPLMEMDEPGWRFVIETNLMSYVACTQQAVERMRRSGRDDCSVILVGSISVHIKAVGESVYNAAKGGVASFAETLRKELMPEGIRVSLIEPGAIGSAMQPFPVDERVELMQQHKLLPAEEVADAIMFAASRRSGVDVVTLRIEPQFQKIF